MDPHTYWCGDQLLLDLWPIDQELVSWTRILSPTGRIYQSLFRNMRWYTTVRGGRLLDIPVFLQNHRLALLQQSWLSLFWTLMAHHVLPCSRIFYPNGAMPNVLYFPFSNRLGFWASIRIDKMSDGFWEHFRLGFIHHIAQQCMTWLKHTVFLKNLEVSHLLFKRDFLPPTTHWIELQSNGKESIAILNELT